MAQLSGETKADLFCLLLRSEGYQIVEATTARRATLEETIQDVRSRATGDTPFEAIMTCLN